MAAESFYTLGVRGIFLRVRAKPGARRDGVTGMREGELLVEVRARPEHGKANQEIIRVLARELGVPKDGILLKLGGASRRKVFELPLACAAAVKRYAGGLKRTGDLPTDETGG